jgi:hypothetical protein
VSDDSRVTGRDIYSAGCGFQIKLKCDAAAAANGSLLLVYIFYSLLGSLQAATAGHS